MYNVEFHNLYCLSGSRVSKNSDKMDEECGMHGNEGTLEQNIDWKVAGKSPFRRSV